MRTSRLLNVLLVTAAMGLMTPLAAAQPAVVTDRAAIPWQQADRNPSFTVAVERRVFMPIDRAGRIVLTAQRGLRGPKIEELQADWRITREGNLVAQGSDSLASGMVALTLDIASLSAGQYSVSADLKHGENTISTQSENFEVKPDDVTPATSGRVALILPRGVQVGEGAQWPLTTGVPFPKGMLFDTHHVRVVDAQGKPVPAQFTVRSRWGFEDGASIRWLSVDLQSPDAQAWWPDRKHKPYVLEFGPSVAAAHTARKVTAAKSEAGYRIDTGPLQFTVRQQGFNLIDEVTLDGKPMMSSSAKHGLYLVDHEGSIYRAANDRDVKLTLEEQGDLRVVIRAEGWYVKDDSPGVTQNIELPTDKLCKFITRLEAYAGQPYVRVLSTWMVTYDSHAVRLRDLGLSLPASGVTQARFGVEGEKPIDAPVPPQGVTLLQHLPDRFEVQAGMGGAVTTGKHSDGNVLATQDNDSVLAVSHRETWQRFPKQITVRPDELRFHIWPADGRHHPEIDIFSADRFHQLWFVHQGKEMNLAFPWEMLFATMRISDDPSTGIYKPAGNAMGGVHSNALGIAITSDLLIQFQPAKAQDKAARIAHAFQQKFHALPDPMWLADSGALGLIQPYDPEQFPQYELAAQRMLKGSWDTQSAMGEYGMFLYRLWHHGGLQPGKRWGPYRLYSAGHHYEPYVPWLYYARSGDPFLLDNGSATIRQMSDTAIIHHADDRLVHREFHFGQRHLVGSTRHTNGMVAWGGDHAVIGHLTCYNGLMLAHYLTGDLRLREVVDQWHRTITQDRLNPELERASRWGEGRDNNNGLGELIDLYQLTYDPALLAYIGPARDRFQKNMKIWGLPLQNVLNFSRDPAIHNQLIESARLRASNDRKDPYQLFTGHSHESQVSLASHYLGDARMATHAMFMLPAGTYLQRAESVYNQTPNAIAFCAIPDTLLHLPAFLKGIAGTMGSQQLNHLAESQPMLMGYRGTRIVLNETTDGPLELQFIGAFKKPVDVQIFGPDQQLLHRQDIPEGPSFKLTLPADGRTGQYVVLATFSEAQHQLVSPISNLPGEVYVVDAWSQLTPSRHFTRLGNAPDNLLEVRPHKARGDILSSDLGTSLASTTTGEELRATVGEQGVWVILNSRYASSPNKRPLILSVTPERFFVPDPATLTLKPLPAAKP